ncbi:hypothetical protein [Bradyrhizobium guangdongense]|uniref:hypothetical protein n=1 Tax=Bradyrhizobium guangdongense TaxID=1325090 RepID=UPI001319D63E|nr:hypothetical protein [Bradyrhizobium guangdongense]
MPLDGSELVEVQKEGQKLLVQLRSFSNRIFKVVTDASASRKAKSSDAGARIVMTSDSACQVVIPADVDGSGFDDGASFEVEQGGAGQVTIVPADGVTINTAETLMTAKRYATLYLVRESANQWHCCGYQQAAG